jgi:hypothetical protein
MQCECRLRGKILDVAQWSVQTCMQCECRVHVTRHPLTGASQTSLYVASLPAARSYFTLPSLGILCATYLVFMILVGGIVIPGGLFMPSIMVWHPLLCPTRMHHPPSHSTLH